MENTRSTLLVRLKDRSDQAAWRTFDALYRPMLTSYARSRGLSHQDAEDVSQQCAAAVLEHIADYEHAGSFKAWLRSIAGHKIADQFRKRREVQPGTGVLTSFQDTGDSTGDQWERQWSMSHLLYCAEMVRTEVAPGTYNAFVGYAIEGRPPAEVGESLGMTANQVYVAKHRVIERIRALVLELTGENLGGELA